MDSYNTQSKTCVDQLYRLETHQASAVAIGILWLVNVWDWLNVSRQMSRDFHQDSAERSQQ